MSTKALEEKLKEIQQQKNDLQDKKQLLEKLEKELIETEKIYQESLAQEIQKQEKCINLTNYLNSKIDQFNKKAKELNLTKLKFQFDKDKRNIKLYYVDENDYQTNVFAIYDYSKSRKSDVVDMIEFHISKLDIYNQLINELPDYIFEYLNYNYKENIIAIDTEETSHRIKIFEDSNKVEVYSRIDTYDLRSFIVKLNDAMELEAYLTEYENTESEINLELSRTSIINKKDIAKQIKQDMNDIMSTFNNDLKINN